MLEYKEHSISQLGDLRKALIAVGAFVEVAVRCPKCGLKIPFPGNTCLYCQAKEAKAKQYRISTVLFGLCGGFVGYLFTQEMGLIDHLGYTLLCGLLGAVAGILLELSGILKRR